MKNLVTLTASMFALVCATAEPLAASSSSSSSSYQPSSPYGTWQPLVNQPEFVSYDLTNPFDPVAYPGGVVEPRLLTDGSIIVQNNGYWATSEMWKLTPDEYGSYVNGTWSQVASMPWAYTATSGAVLADGRLLIAGAEYIDWDFKFLLPNFCALFDPVEGSWQQFPGPFFFTNLYGPRASYAPSPIGDAANVVLADGTFMQQDKMSTQAALLDLKTLTWKETGTNSKGARWNDEEGLTLLPNGKVLTVNCYTESHFIPDMYPYPNDPTGSQIYDPKTGEWESAGSTIVTLTEPVGSETGAAILRPNGTVFAIGASGNTSIYDYHKKTWTPGPRLPEGPGEEGQLGQQDGPAALLPNGNVLFPASPIDPLFSPPAHFFVFDGSSLYEQPNIPNATGINPSFGTPDAAWMITLLVLPTGQVLAVDSSNDVQIYTPDDRSYNPDWAPVIHHGPKKVEANKTYKIKGIRFNGMSQSSAFGDESQNATNYPLVRITNEKTGHVFYCRTHDHSSMAVASDKKVHTYFDVPANIEHGKSKLEVVANGIPSKPLHIVVE